MMNSIFPRRSSLARFATLLFGAAAIAVQTPAMAQAVAPANFAASDGDSSIVNVTPVPAGQTSQGIRLTWTSAAGTTYRIYRKRVLAAPTNNGAPCAPAVTGLIWFNVANPTNNTATVTATPLPGFPGTVFFDDFSGARTCAAQNETFNIGVSYQYAIIAVQGANTSPPAYDNGSIAFAAPTVALTGQTSTWNSTPSTNPVVPTSPATTTLPDRVLLTFQTAPGASLSFIERRVIGNVNGQIITANTAEATAPFTPLAAPVVGYNYYDDASAISQVVYQYRIRSFSATFGYSAWSLFTTGCRLTAPAVQSASDAEFADRVIVNWNPPSDWSVSGYRVYRKKSGDYASSAWTQLTDTALSSTTFTFQDPPTSPPLGYPTPQPGQVYDYAVTAEWATAPTGNAGGTTTLATQRGVPNVGMLVVPPATALSATNNLTGYVALAWTAPTNIAPSAVYQVQRRITGGTAPFKTIRTQANTRYFDDTAVAGTNYDYRVVVQASNGVTSVPTATVVGLRVPPPVVPDP